MSHTDVEVAIIGGTGVYTLEGLENAEAVQIDTPFGKCHNVKVGTLDGHKVAFMTRHGAGHSILPSEVNFRANVYAAKKIGVKYMFAVSACGALNKGFKPGDLVAVTDFIDRTKTREATFFGNGILGHIGFGRPVCMNLHKLAVQAIKEACPDATLHEKGTYVCMEGPAFSTQAESRMYQMWGGDVIGMTALTEAKLAREAEIAYMCIGLVTDIDSWSDDDHAEVSAIMAVIKANSAKAQAFTCAAAKLILKEKPQSDAHTSLASGLMTRGDAVTPEMKERMGLLFGKYWN
eukprot:TRINITY_DN1372_c0_g1_i1.p1 TRINITY_DN1372_c0_g1~~TRINITY_DN1372_c0_g1_i1.p1  ORF type:complete len:291 (+),score=101.44 TRINITY_DN1372_c0_g1_i1:44-916(+)